MDATLFPTRPICFGESGCNNTIPMAMYQFLNITARNYKTFYCMNPPEDSCAFGYCPNPDVASPAVRGAAYISEIGLSILILHSPSDLLSSFYAQLLAVYSLLISVLIAVGNNQVTRLHAVFALIAAGSPLSLYLVTSAVRASWNDFNHWRLTRKYRRMGLSWPNKAQTTDVDGGVDHETDVDEHEQRVKRHRTRLDSIFGPGQKLNKILVILLVPTWSLLFLCVSLPKDAPIWFGIAGDARWKTFSQSACDSTVGRHLTQHFFYGPFLLIVDQTGWRIALVLSPFGGLILTWILCILLQRRKIWKQGLNVGKLPWGRLWSVTTAEYPFVYHLTVVTYPSALWIAGLESGSEFSQEHFQPSYGQLLAIFVAVPPLIQCIMLLPRGGRWLRGLFWFKLIAKAFGCASVRERKEERLMEKEDGVREARGSLENVELMPYRSFTGSSTGSTSPSAARYDNWSGHESATTLTEEPIRH